MADVQAEGAAALRYAPPDDGDEKAELSPGNLFHDPYPVYAKLRRESPIKLFDLSHEWLVTRWEHCAMMGRAPDMFVPSDAYEPLQRVMGRPNILSMSGPSHLCLRDGINESLKPEAVSHYIEPLARPVARQYVEALRERGSADLTTELFEPISVRVVGTVLGLQDVDNDTLVRWFFALNRGVQNVVDDQAVWAAMETVRAEIDEVMRPLVERVTRTPDSSLTSHIVHGGMPDGAVRGFDEIMPTIRVIILGGLQEPGHGAANAMYGLLGNPRQSAAVAAAPDKLALQAYDEGLRWIAPIGITPRKAAQDIEVAGTTIPAGSSVALVLASANRDEARFETPDVFDLYRGRKPHAAFGYAPHYCSGNALSREIGRISLEEVYRSLPNLRLDPDREVVTQGWRFRGVTQLPARWDP